MKQNPEDIVDRLLRLLCDADDSGVRLHGVINFSEPEFSLERWDRERRRLVRWRVSKQRVDPAAWAVERWELDEQLRHVEET